MKTELSQKLESKMLEMLIVKSYPSSCYHFSASRPRLLSTQTTLGKGGLLSRQKSSRYIMFSEEEP